MCSSTGSNITEPTTFIGEAKFYNPPKSDPEKKYMLNFLEDLIYDSPKETGGLVQTIYRHSYPLVGYRSTTEEDHNPQLIFPIPIIDALKNDLDWSDEYEKFRTAVPLPGWERGIVNRVIADNKVMYIPMFDMSGIFYDSIQQLNEAFGTVLSSRGFDSVAHVYYTGKSYHVYVPRLVSQTEWTNMLHELLVGSNFNGDFKPDVKWIGHALIQGFTAIRISNHNPGVKPTIPYLVFANGKSLNNNPYRYVPDEHLPF